MFKAIHEIDRKWTVTFSTNFAAKCELFFALTQEKAYS